MSLNIQPDQARIIEFCKKWKITEFAVFGSVLRKDFRPDSDVDVLVVVTIQLHLKSIGRRLPWAS